MYSHVNIIGGNTVFNLVKEKEFNRPQVPNVSVKQTKEQWGELVSHQEMLILAGCVRGSQSEVVDAIEDLLIVVILLSVRITGIVKGHVLLVLLRRYEWWV